MSKQHKEIARSYFLSLYQSDKIMLQRAIFCNFVKTTKKCASFPRISRTRRQTSGGGGLKETFLCRLDKATKNSFLRHYFVALAKRQKIAPCAQGDSFPRISRTYGLSFKRDWYQVSVSVTTKPQSASFPRISRTYGLSI